jgi:tetratricopeptide (TPR) repeat protein/DNA-binding winged helix-turn-helix (wHTH) protein
LSADLLQGFYLGDLLVEPAKGRVTGPDGDTHLHPKAAEVLLCLADRPGEVVPRTVLLKAAWVAGQGSEEALTHAVSELRHALNDHADDPKYIQTLPRHGYRLLVDPRASEIGSHSGGFETQDSFGPALSGFINDLKRRGVLETGAAYLVLGWLLIQVADTTFDNLGFPAWAEPLVNFTVIGGFPIVILLSWFFEFVEGRVVKDRGQQSARGFAGLGRNFLSIVVAFVVAGIGSGTYQATVGFDVPGTPAPVEADLLEQTELLPVDEDSVAVLKLMTFNDDEVTRAFAEGLSEDLIDGLTRVPGLSVSSRGDAWSLPPNSTSKAVRRRLRVARYVEGSVRHVDGEISVVAQLIDSNSGMHIVSRRFDYKLEDFLDLQREMGNMIIANLRPAWDGNMEGRIMLAGTSENADAYLYYRRGAEALYEPRTQDSIDRARSLFASALEIDPAYPAAHAGICAARIEQFVLTRDPDDVAAAEAACGEAFAVAPRLPQVLRAVAKLYTVTGRDDEAKSLYESALEINGQDAASLTGLATIAQRQQDHDEAVRLISRAIDLQPGNWNNLMALGNIFFRAGDYDRAVEQYRKVVFLNPDNFAVLGNLGSASLMAGDFELAKQALEQSLEIETNPIVYSNLGVVYYYLGDFDKSVEVHRKVVELRPNSDTSWINLADALHFAGERSESRQAFERAAELSEAQLQVNANDSVSIALLAWARAMTGHTEEAVTLASRAVDLDPANTYSHYYHALTLLQHGDTDAAIEAIGRAIETGYSTNMLRAEPYLQELASNPGFQRLLARAEN